MPLLAEREAIKAKLMIFESFVETANLSSDTLVFEERLKENKSLYSQFDSVQSQIEIIVADTKLQIKNIEERETFEAIYLGVICGAEKRLNDHRRFGSHTASRHPVIQLPNFDGIVEELNCLMEWGKRVMQETDGENVCEDIKSLQKWTEYLEKQGVTQSAASSMIKIEESEDLHATNSSEHSWGTNSSIVARHEMESLACNRKCYLCESNHVLHKCPKLLAMTLPERLETVRNLRVCFNCFYWGHNVKECTRNRCTKCGKKHHVLLHQEKQGKVLFPKPQPVHIAQACIGSSINKECTILSTAIVYVIDDVGNKHQCRALLDAGSQVNLITEDFCNKLKLAINPVDVTHSSIGNNTNSILLKTQLRIISGYNEFIADISCLILKNITEKISNVPLAMVTVPMPSGITPADPLVQYPNKIDLLIGAGLFCKLLLIGQYKIKQANLVWQKTRLGWVLGGCFYPSSNENEF